MPAELGFSAALLIGLLGSSHCLGMCGGIVGALNMGINPDSLTPAKPRFGYQLSYNTGRILSYMLIGLLAGSFGQGLLQLVDPIFARVIAAAFLVALGLYLANWWRGLALLERWGQRVWRHIQPLSRHLLPVHNLRQAFMLGMLWGWLPCGLVYAVLVWALTSADPIEAAILMLGFGLGTLPALLFAGELSRWLADWVRSPKFRALAGLAIITLGVVAMLFALQDKHHQVHTSASSEIREGIPESIRVPAILHSLS